MRTAVINSINGSKVFLSGSVLIYRQAYSCAFWSWSVVAQTSESSNNLFYGPPDLSVFCADDHTVLIVLPAHAKWASAYGVPANTNTPSWRPISGPPDGHECWSGARDKGAAPSQGIRPCDMSNDKAPSAGYSDETSNWLLRTWYSRFVAWNYNRLAQPGVSQGSISVSPIMPGTKSTWDVQGYESTMVGPGWAGLQIMYERDRKAVDDFDSFTASFLYDMRLRNGNPYWFCLGSDKSGLQKGANCNPDPKKTDTLSPPIVGFRPFELSLRGGPEWAPAAEKIKGTFMAYATDSKSMDGKDTVFVRPDLNLVGGMLLRAPVIINPFRRSDIKQPAQLTFVPVAGVEGGVRAISHHIGIDCPGDYSASDMCMTPSHWIFRGVLGVDASERLPFNVTRTFLGDRPITLDFSYRARRPMFAEPFFDLTRDPFSYMGGEYAPAQRLSTRWRSYTRVTLIAPFSAYLQARASWQAGSLPPLFQFVGSEVTLGLAFSNPGSSEH